MTNFERHPDQLEFDFIKPEYLKRATHRYEYDISSATYFELRPVFDDDCTLSSYLYGEGEANYVQIRMGQAGRPCALVAKYRFSDVRQACDDFFDLSTLRLSLWYSGNDILAQVIDRTDMAMQIANERFNAEDPELDELFDNVGLQIEERNVIRAKLKL